MVATVSVGILLVAGDTMTGAEQQLENEQTEDGFVELSQQMRTASTNNEISRSMDLAVGQNGAVVTTDTGNIRINGGGVDENISIGAIEYEGDDGTRIAYQAGGVFRETGPETRIVSSPPISYNSERESLTFPIVNVRNETQLSSGEVYVDHHETDPLQNATLIENDSVTITVTSKYYRGWERYFRTEASGASIQEVDQENQTVRVLLGYAEIDGAFDEGLTIGSDDPTRLNNHKNKFGEDPRTGTPYPEMDPVIENIVADAKAGDNVTKNISAEGYTNPLDNGTYFVEEIDGTENYEFDLSSGNATLIVENDVILEDGGSISVVDQDDAEENVLRIYSEGNHTLLNGEICAETCGDDAEVIQFYGPSTMSVDFGPGNTGAFEGTLYVASSEENDWWDKAKGKCSAYHQVHMQGGGDFYGSVVAYSACSQSNSVSFDHDPDLADTDIDPYYSDYALPPQLTYLNVAIHELDVENQ